MFKVSILISVFVLTLFGNFSMHKSQADNTNSAFGFQFNSIEGNNMPLSDFEGKVLLVVNTASKCGFTKQYAELEKLFQTYKNELVVIGSPCNQFGGQEPGDAEEIKNFCTENFGVSFILTEKIDVKGNNISPLYTWLTDKKYNGVLNSSVKWNFQKYLVDRDGKLINYFYSTTNPLSDKITSLIILE